jgi:hypothetical protein
MGYQPGRTTGFSMLQLAFYCLEGEGETLNVFTLQSMIYCFGTFKLEGEVLNNSWKVTCCTTVVPLLEDGMWLRCLGNSMRIILRWASTTQMAHRSDLPHADRPQHR